MQFFKVVFLLTKAVVRFVSVVILCGSAKFIRDFMLTAHQSHMTNGQYVYVVAHQVPPGNVNTPWVAGDDQDDTARLSFESVLQVRTVNFSSSYIRLITVDIRNFYQRNYVICQKHANIYEKRPLCLRKVNTTNKKYSK